MRFLMVCMQFPTGPGQSYLTTELADALVAAGHGVEVLLLDWAATSASPAQEYASPGGARVVRVTPRRITGFGRLVEGASKFLLSGRRAARAARERFDLKNFDAAIAWAPASALGGIPALLERAGVASRQLFVWDMFPDHHHEIGRIPGGLPLAAARALEQRQLERFTTIFCTLPGNAAYLRRRFRLRADQELKVLPIWSATTPLPPVNRAAVRRRHGLPEDRPIAVFGGQLVEGRGFEQMLAAAELAELEGSPLLFLFVGDGRLAPMIAGRVRARSNLAWRPAMTREAYLELLGACDVGMAATVPGVTSFSIPSKTLDYLRAGLPVIAAVEHGSDFPAILERYGVGCSVGFGDAEAFRREAERLALDPGAREASRSGAPLCLDEVFDVRHAVRAVLAAAGERSIQERQTKIPVTASAAAP